MHVSLLFTFHQSEITQSQTFTDFTLQAGKVHESFKNPLSCLFTISTSHASLDTQLTPPTPPRSSAFAFIIGSTHAP